MNLLGVPNEKYAGLDSKEISRLRKTLMPVVDRQTFVTYYCARATGREKRGAFYDALVEARANGEPFYASAYAREHKMKESILYGWLDVILGLRLLDAVVTKAAELTRDEFIRGRSSKSGELLPHQKNGNPEARAKFYDWFMANRDNPNRERLTTVCERLGVTYPTAQYWRERLGGFNVETRLFATTRERNEKIVEVLEKIDRPISVMKIAELIGFVHFNYPTIRAALVDMKREDLLDRVITARALTSENYNQAIDYINRYEELSGVPPTQSALQRLFGMSPNVRRRALAERKKIVLSQHEQNALDAFLEWEEREFQKEATSAPYERDEDWLARVEDVGYKGFDFTGDYWKRYRAFWEKKRADGRRQTDSRIRREIQRGRDPLEAQCYGPSTQKKKISPIFEFAVKFLNLN